MSKLKSISLNLGEGKIVLINPAAIESVRSDSPDGIVRMISGQEHRIKGVATSERWINFLIELDFIGEKDPRRQ